MMIGPQDWKWFTTDTAGVPQWGIWGDVRAFEVEAEPHGLHVAWSGIFNCFVIYTELFPGEFTLQDIRKDQVTGRPRPLDQDYLSWLIRTWEMFGRMSKRTIHALRAQADRDWKHKLDTEDREANELTRREVLRGWRLRTGRRDPKIFSLPKGPVKLQHGK